MSDSQPDANAARIEELRTQRAANLAKARAAKAGRREDAEDPKSVAEHQPTQLQKVALNAEAEKARKVEALRRAKAANQPDAPPEKLVSARVTKAGHMQISMGEHVAGLGDLTYEKNEIILLSETTALDLEARHFVEIQDD